MNQYKEIESIVKQSYPDVNWVCYGYWPKYDEEIKLAGDIVLIAVTKDNKKYVACIHSLEEYDADNSTIYKCIDSLYSAIIKYKK